MERTSRAISNLDRQSQVARPQAAEEGNFGCRIYLFATRWVSPATARSLHIGDRTLFAKPPFFNDVNIGACRIRQAASDASSTENGEFKDLEIAIYVHIAGFPKPVTLQLNGG